jgi:hypothetical protein
MNTFDLARAYERGACPECTTPRRVVFHYEDSRCPFNSRGWHQVPCRNLGCGRVTMRNDACCSDVCAAQLADREARALATRAVRS